MRWQLVGDHIYLSEEGTFVIGRLPTFGDFVLIPFDIPDPKLWSCPHCMSNGIGRLKLNNCVMRYEVVPSNLTNGDLEQGISVEFLDFRINKTVKLYIKDMSKLNWKGGHDVILKTFQEGFTSRELSYHFSPCLIPTDGLIYDADERLDDEDYTSLWGLTEFPTRIYWVDDFKLDGTCYVFVFGHWGILLTDDLQVDAIVAIREVDSDDIRLQDCIWTSNPYIAKIMMMRRPK